MGDFSTLLKLGLKSELDSMAGGDRSQGRLTSRIILFIIFTLCVELILYKGFIQLKTLNIEGYILHLIYQIEIGIIFIYMVIRVLTSVFLNNQWRQFIVFPMKWTSYILANTVEAVVISIGITLVFIIPKITYGLLSGEGLGYYINTLIYNLTIVTLPCLFILIIGITFVGLMGIIKKVKINIIHYILILFLDLVLAGVIYILVSYRLKGGIATILVDFFINVEGLIMARNYALVFGVLGLAFLIIYIFGIETYLKILKANIFNTSYKSKANIGNDLSQYKAKGVIYSNVIRDIKIIYRTPALRLNCITINIVFSALFAIATLVLKDYLVLLRGFIGLKGFLIAMCLLTLMVGNLTLTTPYSREGRFANMLKSFPLNSDSLIWSKIIVSLISNLPVFIAINIFTIIISSTIIEFVVFEILIIVYMVLMAIIYMGMDMKNPNLKWDNIKNLFSIEATFKQMGKYFSITILFVVYILLSKFIGIIKYEFLTVGVFILIGGLNCIGSIKTILELRKI